MTMKSDTEGYLQYLPAQFHQDRILEQFLKMFEAVLTGSEKPVEISGKPVIGLEQTIDRLSSWFTPQGLGPDDQSPDKFLAWLAGWVALTLREDWSIEKQRHLIKQVVSWYPIRGTKKALETYLRLYLEAVNSGDVVIEEDARSFQVGIEAELNKTTIVGGLPDHYFRVKVRFGTADPQLRQQRRRAIESILDQEKPAHTYYQVETSGSTFQLGVLGKAELGQNTVI